MTTYRKGAEEILVCDECGVDDTSTKPASVDTSSRHVDGENTTEPTGAA